jgi:predicted transcriptional regulator
VRQSVSDDHLVCLDCGIHATMLKRHIRAAHNLSPEQYRQRWNLPGDYPMVAPDYAQKRSDLAKASGLGRRR